MLYKSLLMTKAYTCCQFIYFSQENIKEGITGMNQFYYFYDLIFISDVYDWSDDSDSSQIIPVFPNSWV